MIATEKLTSKKYDGLNRVTMEKITHNTTVYQTQSWTYDLVGNRKTQVKNNQTTYYEYDANDRLTSETGVSNLQYDVTRLTRKGTANYTYDSQGRMSGMTDGSTTVTYQYNGRGTRVSQTVNGVKSIFVIDPQNMTGYDQVIVEKNASNVLQRSYTIGQELISQYEPAATYYFLFDGLGNVRSLLSTTGTSAERYDYDAFGNAIGHPATPKTSHLYCGEMFDVKSGYYYLRARYYDPKVGRFNRLDPFFGNISDPQSLHKYTYCHGDPVNNVDPSGMFLTVTISFSSAARTMSLTINARATLHAYNSIVGGITNGIGNMYSDTPGLSRYTRFGLGFLGGYAGSYLASSLVASFPKSPAAFGGGVSSALTSAFTTILNCICDPVLREKFEPKDIPSHILSVFVDAIVGALGAATISKMLPPIKPGTTPPRLTTEIFGEIMPIYIEKPFGLTLNPWLEIGGNTKRVLFNETLIGVISNSIWSAFKYLCSWIVPEEMGKIP